MEENGGETKGERNPPRWMLEHSLHATYRYGHLCMPICFVSELYPAKLIPKYLNRLNAFLCGGLRRVLRGVNVDFSLGLGTRASEREHLGEHRMH